ncbi:GAF domain-containing protein [Arthrobacter sp. PL16]|uniref:GAF domain-containing protein n=1 Tax=Arthrobacter sp. PL16 TaxID=3071720 RepID=UPI002DFC0BD7|nr:GAF domain-containing protein [Arthrobacter sp. PL16]
MQWLRKHEAATSFFNSVWSTIISAAIVLAGGFLITNSLRNLNDPNVLQIIAGAVVSVLGWALGHFAKKMESAAKEHAIADVESSNRIALAGFNNKLIHVYTALEKVVDPKTRKLPSVEAYIESVMVCSVNLFQVQDIRACLYIVDGDVNEDDSTDPALLVHRAPQYGRTDQPRRSFERGTPHGDLLFKVLTSRDPLHIPDITQTELPIDSPDKRYKSFIAVSITSEETELGVLMIDGTKKGELVEEHVTTAQTLAALLAIGLKLTKPTTRTIRPSRGASDATSPPPVTHEASAEGSTTEVVAVPSVQTDDGVIGSDQRMGG